jgi:hypothetical protein
MKKLITICAVSTMIWAASGSASAITIDGVFDAGEWDGKELSVGTMNVVAGAYELPSVCAYATEDTLYMAFETVGAQLEIGGYGFNAVVAMNIGADRTLTTSSTAKLGDNGLWSFAMENFSNTADGVFSTGHSDYKYNDNDVDGDGTGQNRDMDAMALGSDFSIAFGYNGATQIIEYAISMDVIETAFARTYQNGAISAGDELQLIGFFNRGGSGNWSPISYPIDGTMFHVDSAYATVTVVPEPTTIALLGLGGLLLRIRKTGLK